ncbi:MAG: EAL domain-containing protein [Ilumatobacter sp.]|nr:MAG: EAL domain-containing protein [Ilumatobacter sp.]
MIVVAVGVSLLAIAAAGFAIGWFQARRGEHRLLVRLRHAAAAEAEVRRVLDELPEAVLLLDASGTVQSVNAAAGELTGRDDLVGMAAASVVVDDDHDLLRYGWDQTETAAISEPVLVRLIAPSPVESAPGTAPETPREAPSTIVEATFHAARGHTPGRPPGRPDRVVLRLRDVTDRERQSAALAQARRRFQQAFHSAPTGMSLVRLDDGRVVDVNQSLADMLGYPVESLVGRTLRGLTHPDDVSDAVPHLARLELGIVDTYRLDQRFRRADGEYIWARTRVSTTEDDGVTLAITHIEDVTEQRRTAELLTHAARHDDLTGLPNRAHLVQLLDERLDGAPEGSVAVLFIDLDQFKVVNDGLGHTSGDEVLIEVARRLTEAVRDDDALARFGGDEFVVVLDGRGQAVDAREVAERLRRSCLRPIEIDEHELFVTASIGYTLNTEPGVSAGDLLRDADAAMYRAKARGRDTVEAFEREHRESTALALRTVGELRKGIERHELVPYFQPIVDLDTGRLLGHEVLARWLHPDRGLLPPAEFLDVAEEHGLIVDLGAAMLRDSLAQVARWRAAGADIGRGFVSVNVATRQLIDPAFHDLVAEVLAETGIDADSLWLEITETSLLADVKQVTVALRRLRSLGLHLSVDDFGTGYSSLTYLRRFPVEAIKIDRGFVAGLGLETDDTTIVDAVIKLGQALGLAVVAEGIETPLQLSRLRELGCDRGQGYLFGRPRPAQLIEPATVVEELDA